MTVLIDSVPVLTYPSPAAARETAVEALVDFALRYRGDLAYRSAKAGDGAGGLLVPGAYRRIYCRLGSANGPVAEAQADVWIPAIDDDVLLHRVTVLGTGGWVVLGWLNGTAPCV